MIRSLYFILVSITLASCGPDHAGETKTTLAFHFRSISDNEDMPVAEKISNSLSLLVASKNL